MCRLLMVDEDRTARDILAQALSMDNYQIEVACQGTDALRRLAAKGVDILITEVHLTDIPAWDLIPEVYRIDPDIPVITMTADDTWETSRRVRENGPIFFYGLKPVNLREMREAVRSAARWRQKRRSNLGISGGGQGEAVLL